MIKIYKIIIYNLYFAYFEKNIIKKNKPLNELKNYEIIMRCKKRRNYDIVDIKRKPIIPYQPKFKFFKFYLITLKILIHNQLMRIEKNINKI